MRAAQRAGNSAELLVAPMVDYSAAKTDAPRDSSRAVKLVA